MAKGLALDNERVFDDFFKKFTALEKSEKLNYCNFPFTVTEMEMGEDNPPEKTFNTKPELDGYAKELGYFAATEDYMKEHEMVIGPMEASSDTMRMCYGWENSECDSVYSFKKINNAWRLTDITVFQ